jgi:hypothetical protein
VSHDTQQSIEASDRFWSINSSSGAQHRQPDLNDMREAVYSFTAGASDAESLGNDLAVRRELQSISIRVYSQPVSPVGLAEADPFVVRIFEGSD